MRSVLLSFCLLTASTLSFRAENLLKNADFSEISEVGLPLHWDFKGKSSENCAVVNKQLELKAAPKEKALIIQRNLPLEAGTQYQALTQIRSPDNATYLFYCEWKKDGNILQSASAPRKKASSKWGTATFTFALPDTAVNPYLVVALLSPGTLHVKDIALQPVLAKAMKGPFGGIWQCNTAELLPATEGSDGIRLFTSRRQEGAILKEVNLEPGQWYRFSYDVAGEGSAETDTGYHLFRVYAHWPDLGQSAGESWRDVTNSFQRKEFVFQSPGRQSHLLDFVFEMKSEGSLIFKNFTLEKVLPEEKPAIQLSLTSPHYRNMIFSSDPVETIRGVATVTSDVQELRITLKDIKSGANLWSHQYVPANAEVQFQIPAASLQVGEYELKLQGVLASAKTSTSVQTVIHKLPKAPNEVLFKSDNIVYCNNEPFFPIMFFGLPATDDTTMYKAANNGINCFRAHGSSPEKALEILDQAHKFRMKVILGVYGTVSSDEDKLRIWEHRTRNYLVKEVRNHPALLGYMTFDEPQWGGRPLACVLKTYQILKDIDPYHPVWINEAPRGSIEALKKYAEGCDIFGVDIYPVPYPNTHSGLDDKGLTSVGKYTKRSLECVDFRKPIWMVLQGFAWKRKTLIYPTLQETRFMAYDAITSGATGISYYGMSFIDKYSFYEILFDVTREISSLSQIFVEGEHNPDLASSENNAIRLYPLIYDNEFFIVALNTEDRPVNATIALTRNFSHLNILKENRQIEIDERTFTDLFQPYDTHVYYTGKPLEKIAAIPFDAELEAATPFRDSIQKNMSVETYSGTANWIWQQGKARVPYSNAWFVRKIELNDQIKTAQLMVTADDSFNAYINGHHVCTGKSWSNAKMHDVKDVLRMGENTILVQASDEGIPPCGLLAELNIETVDGKEIKVVTDKDWKVLTAEADAKELPDPNVKGEPAEEIAPYGQGAWRSRVKLNRN